MAVESERKPLSARRGPDGRRESLAATLLKPLDGARHYVKWMRPGMRVKRWLFVAMLGIAVLVAGVDLMFLLQLSDIGDRLNNWLFEVFGRSLTDVSQIRGLTYQAIIGIPTALLGLLVFLLGVRNILGSVTSAVMPSSTEQPIVDVIWRRRQLAHGARIVVIGGGTGLSTMLRGLKQYTSNLTAVVTVTDDGGSSGRLQREFNMLPPGDIRNCLVALADAEPLMQELFQYRFQGVEGSSLQDHSFGNLLIAAMLHITGDFEEAVRQTSRVLAIRGRVLPSTLRNVRLMAELDNGSIVEGETSITAAGKLIHRIFLDDPEAEPLDETLEAIRTADAIIIGPGSVYTSVVPNFLVKGVAEAVAESRAIKMYVCNVMTQPGETTDFSASDHVKAVIRQAGIPVFDHVLVNVQEPSEEARSRYAGVGSHWVLPDVDEIRRLGLKPIVGDFINQNSYVRHDPDKLAEAIIRVVNRTNNPVFWMLDYREWL